LLTLRQEQTDLFSHLELERFEARVIAHLRQYFPQRMANVSEQNARGLVRFCVGRARRYGIVTERALVLYIGVAVTLGTRFDQRHAWAAETLRDEFIATPEARVEELHRRAVAFLDGTQERAAPRARREVSL
jgi:hypothetical protein